jgi:hypothetical protein
VLRLSFLKQSTLRCLTKCLLSNIFKLATIKTTAFIYKLATIKTTAFSFRVDDVEGKMKTEAQTDKNVFLRHLQSVKISWRVHSQQDF